MFDSLCKKIDFLETLRKNVKIQKEIKKNTNLVASVKIPSLNK
jgi:hypothetical protein